MELKVVLNIYNLYSQEEVLRIDNTLQPTTGILDVIVDYELQQATVIFDPRHITLQRIIAKLENLGYEVEVYTN